MNSTKTVTSRTQGPGRLWLAALLLSVLCAADLLAAPALRKPLTLTQPNGTKFEARLGGDEFFNWVEEKGRIIGRGKAGFWRYQTLQGGRAVLSSRRVGLDAVPGNAAALRDLGQLRRLGAQRAAAVDGASLAQGSPAANAPANATEPLLVLLVEFTDRALTTTEAQWANAMFGATGKTVRTYYQEVSRGGFYFAPAAETSGTTNDGIIKVTLNYPHPNTGSSTGNANRQIVRDALIAADPSINYAAFSTDGDGGLSTNELHVITVVAGYERAYSSSYTPSVWGHRWSLWGTVEGPVLDGVAVGAYDYDGGYSQFGELHATHMATIGIMCHELGHDIGLPDLYDTDGSSSGIGGHGLMSSGSWGAASGESAGATPTLMSAWSRIRMGFITPTVVTAGGSFNMTESRDLAYNVLKIPTPDADEYFLVENRQLSGFDAGLYRWFVSSSGGASGGGLAIWHIDDSRTNNSDETHKWVDVEEANEGSLGYSELDLNSLRANRHHLWYVGHVTQFGDTTTPDTRLYNGTQTNITITATSAAGPVMTCTVNLGSVALPDYGVDQILFEDASHPLPNPLSGTSTVWFYHTTRNNGAAAATAQSYTRFYLSPDAVITGGGNDIPLDIDAVPALPASGTDSAWIQIGLPGMVPGTYYVGAKADDGDAVTESDESNNVAVAPGTITVTDSFTLTVQSTPITDIDIASTVPQAAGATDYEVAVTDGTVVTLTAPQSVEYGSYEYLFVRWHYKDIDQPDGERALTFTMFEDAVAVAIYELFEPAEAIVDDRDRTAAKRFTVLSGAWQESWGASLRWGLTYRWAYANSGAANARVRFTATTLPAGEYDVSVWWPSLGNTSVGQNVPFEIHHAAGVSTVRKDQAQDRGQWVSLGRYDFAAGAHAVEAHNGAAKPGTYMTVDAVKFTQTGPPGASGAIQVAIEPQGAIDAGAQWRVDDGAWRDSGDTATGLSVGSHAIEYSAVTGWITPDSASVDVLEGETTHATGTYTVVPTGSVQVTLTPQGALDGGAQWRVDGGAWQSSGSTVSGLSVGAHTVDYSVVSGWVAPASESVQVSDGVTTPVTGTYTVVPTGSVQVTLEPQGAIDGGAQWRVDGGAWQSGGATVSGLSLGAHTIEYNTISGWVAPSSEEVQVADGATTQVTGTYTQVPTGSLQVTIEPEGARTAGAQWRVDGGAWQSSGATVSGLNLGAHTVEYSTITGWVTPANAPVTILDGQTTQTTGTYTQVPTGSVQVTLSPQGALDAGAQWQVDGGAWQTSGAVVSGLSVGNHTITYKGVTGWNTPASELIAITNGVTTQATGVYTVVTATEECIVDDRDKTTAKRYSTLSGYWNESWGASQKWGVTYRYVTTSGGETARSRFSCTTLPAGTCEVFAWWPSLGNTSVGANVPFEIHHAGGPTTVRKDQSQDRGQWVSLGTYTFDAGAHVVEVHNGGAGPGTYMTVDAIKFVAQGGPPPPTGSLQVTIEPQGARDAGAQWRVDGGSWHASGATVGGLSVGVHTVDYSVASGYQTPASAPVQINDGVTTQATGTYTAIPTGSAQVTIEPQGARDAGAQWRVDGGAWQASGATVSGLSVDTHTIEYSALSGWTAPSTEQISILDDQTTQTTGTYVQVPTGSLQATLEPEAARLAGAQWQVDGGAWQTSGAVVSGLSLGSHTVAYKSVSGWSAPASVSVTILDGQTTQATGIYTEVVISEEAIVDDRSGGFQVLSGSWRESWGASQRWGLTYRWALTSGGETARSRFSTAALSAGTCEVFAWWPSLGTTSVGANVPYEIHHSGGTTTVRVNQALDRGQWVSLGAYTFAAGAHAVEVHNGGAGPGTYLTVDAIKFVRTE